MKRVNTKSYGSPFLEVSHHYPIAPFINSFHGTGNIKTAHNTTDVLIYLLRYGLYPCMPSHPHDCVHILLSYSCFPLLPSLLPPTNLLLIAHSIAPNTVLISPKHTAESRKAIFASARIKILNGKIDSVRHQILLGLVP